MLNSASCSLSSKLRCWQGIHDARDEAGARELRFAIFIGWVRFGQGVTEPSGKHPLWGGRRRASSPSPAAAVSWLPTRPVVPPHRIPMCRKGGRIRATGIPQSRTTTSSPLRTLSQIGAELVLQFSNIDGLHSHLQKLAALANHL